MHQASTVSLAAAAFPLVRVAASAPKKVLVLGAGLAGLCAAYELTKRGHDVTVIEAQQQAGGRVNTLRAPFTDGQYAEAGAIYIPDTHALPLHYVQEFGLALNTALPTDLAAVRHLRGQRFALRADAVPQWPYDLNAEELALGLEGLLERYQAPLITELGDPSADDWSPKTFAAWDALTLPQLLRQRGASEAAVALMTAGWGDLWGDGLASVSSLAVMRDLALQSGANYNLRLLGGNDALPRAFAQRLDAQVLYGAEARAIEQNARGVRVHVMQNRQRHTLTAERLICAIPYSVLRRLQLPPQWSAGKRQAIESLRMFSAARVSLQMRERFWRQAGESGSAQADLRSITAVFDMTLGQPGSRGILQSYSGGAAARRITAMTEAQRIEFALNELDRVFPGARDHFEQGVSMCWDEQPYARGASCWFRPGEVVARTPHLANAEGRTPHAARTSPAITPAPDSLDARRAVLRLARGT